MMNFSHQDTKFSYLIGQLKHIHLAPIIQIGFAAVRTDIDIASSRVRVKCKAEILAVELVLADGNKIIICTCYRVGTLGSNNHSNIDRFLKTLKRKRKVNSIYLVGDFNLANVNWDTLTSSVNVEQAFVNTFCELGLDQIIDCPTHSKGNILDILLTTEPHKVLNLAVLDGNCSICKSDHFIIQFEINYKARRKKPAKRTIYNFKRANWEMLNNDLRNTNWNNLLGNCDVDTAWLNFKGKLNSLANIHIPKIKIKSEFQPPWFDSEVYNLCREKERLHSRYKETKSDAHYMKFSDCRRKLKHLVRHKMCENFEDENDSQLINKKFWSYVKSNSNSHRIPEVVTHNDISRKKPADQAELFNDFFYQQFSEPSAYDINIDWNNDSDFNIDFNATRIEHFLNKINPNKALGPDEIHGRILKMCSLTLAHPVSAFQAFILLGLPALRMEVSSCCPNP